MIGLTLGQCPPPEEMRRLMQGSIDPVRLEELEDHVQGCPSCQHCLGTLSQENSLPLPPRVEFPEPGEPTAQFLEELAGRIPMPSKEVELQPQVSQSVPEIPGFFQLELVGRGGMGDVYRAWQPELSRWVALKILCPGRGQQLVERTQREARILGRLQHRHIVRIHDIGQHAGRPYLVMEWITGGSLQDRLRQGPLPIREAVGLACQIASALEEVHALGIIHRDLKPANVLLQPAGDAGGEVPGDSAKLTDFSIAFDTETVEKLTITGLIVGTPQYMAPEQTGLAPELGTVGPATDVYGIGAVLYACLTGQAPHVGDSTLATLQRVATREPRPPRNVRVSIPPDLETIVLKCLRTKPDKRYQSVGQFRDDLDRFLKGRPITARPCSVSERAWCQVRQRPAVAIAAAMGLLLGVGSVTGSWYHDRQIQTLTGELTHQANRAWIAQWNALHDLTHKTEMQLEQEILGPEHRRTLVCDLSHRYRELCSPLKPIPADESVIAMVAVGLDSLTRLEEREQLWELLLADGRLKDAFVSRFPESDRIQTVHAQCELRRRRALAHLDRLPEATALVTGLLGELTPVSPQGVVSAVLFAVDEQAQALLDSRSHQAALQLWQLGIEQMERYNQLTPTNGTFWRIRLALHIHQLQALSGVSTAPILQHEIEQWLLTVEDCLQKLPATTPEERLQRVRIVHWCVEQGLSCSPAPAERLLPHCHLELAGLNGTEHEGDIVVEQVKLLALQTRTVFAGGNLRMPSPADWCQALDRGFLFLQHNPREHKIRWDLGWFLIQTARQQRAAGQLAPALESAQRATMILAPLVGPKEVLPGSRAMLADAHYIVAGIDRIQGRLSACLDSLERAYTLSSEGNRDTIALEMVQVDLATNDRKHAEQHLGWIDAQGPQRQEALRLLGRQETANVQPAERPLGE